MSFGNECKNKGANEAPCPKSVVSLSLDHWIRIQQPKNQTAHSERPRIGPGFDVHLENGCNRWRCCSYENGNTIHSDSCLELPPCLYEARSKERETSARQRTCGKHLRVEIATSSFFDECPTQWGTGQACKADNSEDHTHPHSSLLQVRCETSQCCREERF